MATATKTRSSSRMMHLREDIAGLTPRVDKVNGVIRGVKILGRISKNNREYSQNALNQAAVLYEGMAVNLGHPSKGSGDINGNPPVERAFGWLKNVQVRHDGDYGDLYYLKSHPSAPMIVEVAERNPNRLGLSHNAFGVGRVVDGKTIIESVDRVKSVDLVQNPATTGGLFESARLREDESMAGVGDLPIDNTGGSDQLSDAVVELFFNPDMSTAQKLKQFSEMLDAWEALDAAQQAMDDATGQTDDNAMAGVETASDELDNKPDLQSTAESHNAWLKSIGAKPVQRLTESTRRTSLVESTGRPVYCESLHARAAKIQAEKRREFLRQQAEKDANHQFPKDQKSFLRSIGAKPVR